MSDKGAKVFLPCFYIFCLICIVVGLVKLYDIRIENKNRLLTIKQELNIKETNKQVKLELNEHNKNEEVIYKSGNENIVKIDQKGNLTTIGEGTTTVTVTTKDKSKTQTFIVNVGEEAIEQYDKNEDLAPSNKNSNTTTNKSNNNSTNNTNPTRPNNNTSNNSSSNNSNSNNNKNNTNKTVKVTNISLNKSSAEINLNTTTKTISLSATISPSNATNKNVSWYSSNSNVATVQNGLVTGVNPGTATISAKTSDGNKTASMTITVRKRVVIVIGASQVERMVRYNKNSYSSSNYNYNTGDGTLVYIHKSGSGMDYQTGDGLSSAKSIINSYSGAKNQTSFYVFFPLSGNTIKDFSCSQISVSNTTIKKYAENYNNAIQSIKNSGYGVKGYVVSMHPVKVSQASSSNVVTNQNKNACTSGYRSNWKYYRFNIAIKNIINDNYTSNLRYEALFMQIMEVNNEQKNFSYKITYNTTDGIHWDSPTTQTYVNMMLRYSGDL